ncbi:cyclase family protein [Candidatus Sumerlaeota bacterium]|nr:cyclase family protein [Candidatus Sumerlaeota bacterium]
MPDQEPIQEGQDAGATSPPPEPRPPRNWGKWGPEDERGTANYITPEVTAGAAKLVKTGKVFPLAIPLKASSPIWPGRHENWHVAVHQNLCGPGLGGAEDILMIHTHGSTHTDALCHIFEDGILYNGYPATSCIDSRGAKKNSIERLGAIVTRGVLIDAAGFHGVEHLEGGHAISVEEMNSIASAQGVEFASGDAVLFRTGWLKVWQKEREKFNASQPGIGLDVALWAGDKEIAVMAADNSAVEAFPLKDGFLPVHKEFIRNQGGYLMELFDLEALAAAKVYEFMFVVAPLNITMGLGSPITPLAIT